MTLRRRNRSPVEVKRMIRACSSSTAPRIRDRLERDHDRIQFELKGQAFDSSCHADRARSIARRSRAALPAWRQVRALTSRIANAGARCIW